jgi:hypothetical protein
MEHTCIIVNSCIIFGVLFPVEVVIWFFGLIASV